MINLAEWVQQLVVTRLVDGDRAAAVPALAALLLDSVAGGASVGFLDGITAADAEAFWLDRLRAENVVTWLAKTPDREVVGCVRLVLVDLPNGAHRAEISKLLVHSAYRGRGVATALMDAAEAQARLLGRTVLLLDTETDSPAQRLYESRGWEAFGVMRDHAATPDGQLKPTTFMVKYLDRDDPAATESDRTR